MALARVLIVVGLFTTAQYVQGGMYAETQVSFMSDGTKIVGTLFTPTPESFNGFQRYPGIALIGPVTYVKEQAPVQYATRMAKSGYVTLMFDPRNFGASDGEPRQYDSPELKIADYGAALDYLSSLPQVDTTKLFGLGICQGSTELLGFAARDNRLVAMATVAANIVTPENSREMFADYGGLQARLDAGDAARRAYEQTGQVQYMKMVDMNDTSVALPGYGRWAFYKNWEYSTGWKNQIPVMSQAEIWRMDAGQMASQVRIPVLFVHSARSDGGSKYVNQMLSLVQNPQSKLEWMGDTIHTQFYDDPIVIDKATNAIDKFYKQWL